MKKIYLTIITSLIISRVLYSQDIPIDTLHIKPSIEAIQILNGNIPSLYYPIIKTGKIKVDSIVNNVIAKRIVGVSVTDLPSAIDSWYTSLIDMHWEVSYAKEDLLSIQIIGEGCGAYCSIWTEYFNFNMVSGNQVEINEILNDSVEGRHTFYELKAKQFKLANAKLSEAFKYTCSELSVEDYQFLKQIYDECEKHLDMHTFTITPQGVKIICTCDLPRILKHWTPLIYICLDGKE